MKRCLTLAAGLVWAHAALADDAQKPFVDLRGAFQLNTENATISREDPSASAGSGVIPTTPQALYSRQKLSFGLLAELGLSERFTLYGALPLVLADTQQLRLADGLDTSSLIADDILAADLPAEVRRSGLGDATLGLRLGLMEQHTGPGSPDWTLDLSATLPSGSPMAAGSTGVGEGVRGLHAKLLFAKSIAKLRPSLWFQYSYFSPSGTDTLFRDVGKGQRSARPGQEGELGTRIDLLPWGESASTQVNFFLGATYKFVSLGKGYTSMFDFLAEQTADQNGLHGVDASGVASGGVPFDGLLEEEQHGIQQIAFGFDAMIESVIRLQVVAGYQTKDDHFLTFGTAGVDNNGNGIVDNDQEANPFFEPVLDFPGQRLREEEFGNFSLLLQAALHF